MGNVTPEGKVKKKVDDLLKKYGVWFFSPQSGPYGQAGIPDRIACVRGRLVGIEVKANKTSKPTTLQVMQGQRIIASGGLWFLVYDEGTLHVLEDYLNHACAEREETSDLEAWVSTEGISEYPNS
jgi:hypothetical protein